MVYLNIYIDQSGVRCRGGARSWRAARGRGGNFYLEESRVQGGYLSRGLGQGVGGLNRKERVRLAHRATKNFPIEHQAYYRKLVMDALMPAKQAQPEQDQQPQEQLQTQDHLGQQDPLQQQEQQEENQRLQERPEQQ